MKKAIKLIVMLLFAVAMATMSSCSKENSYQRKIVGKWVVVNDVIHWNNVPGEPTTETGPNIGLIWEFRTNGKMIVGGRELPYTIDGDSLFYRGALSTGDWKIVELTNSTMELERTSREYGGRKWQSLELEKR